jgi:molybdopterin molybdotransferase
MITVTEVDKLIDDTFLKLPVEEIEFEQSLGRVLKQKVVADRDFPPFDRAMMDGIAINFSAWQDGVRSFPIEGLQAAGDPVSLLKNTHGCLEVMTGAIIPQGTGTVVKYEEITLEQGMATINDGILVKANQHVHARGMDRLKQDVLLSPDTIISPAELAILATVGQEYVKVAKLPRIAVIATGDELVDVAVTPKQHQIRKSNVYQLRSGLAEKGFPADIYHFVDDKTHLREGLQEVLAAYDVLVLSGGVSKGKLDYVPEILAELGVEKLFHRVKQRPGKPFWFGRYKKGVVFALPGNPVSTFVGLKRYVLPFLYRSAGVVPKVIKARLTEDFNFKPDLTYFLQVSLAYSNEGLLLATPAPGHGSGDLANLVESEAFIELPEGKNVYKKGEAFACYPFR